MAVSASDITNLYQTMLGRAPDPAGMQYWSTQPIDMSTMTADFAASPEYAAHQAAVTQQQQQAQQYQNQMQQMALQSQQNILNAQAQQPQVLAQAQQQAQNNPYAATLQNLMTKPYDALQNDPGYQFQQQQGLDAVNRTMAAQGQLNSGNQQAQLMNYGQGLAASSYGNAVQRALQASSLAGGQGLGLAGLTLQGQGQMFGQNTNAANLAAQQQQQQYNQLYNSALLNNQQQQQQFNNMLSGANFLSGLNQQYYNQLAQLSGASNGSPAAGAQAYQNAQGQGLANIMGGLGVLQNQPNTSTPYSGAYSYGATQTPNVGTGYNPYAGTSYDVGYNLAGTGSY